MAHAHRHPHAHDALRSSTGRLTLSIALNVLLTVAQIVAGLLSGSLALIADALHNLNDAASLGISLLAEKTAKKRADRRRTFGYRRAQTIGALINLTTLIVVGLMLVYQAIERWVNPTEVQGWIVVIVAGVALMIDAATAILVYTSPGQNVNLRALFAHNLADAAASVGVIISGVAILLWDWTWADPAMTLIISAYILWQGFTMIGGTIRTLLESVPKDVDLDALVAAAEEVDGVHEAHHVHVWELDEDHRAMEAHIVIARADAAQMEQMKSAIKQRMADRFNITHATLEFEFAEHNDNHARDLVPEH